MTKFFRLTAVACAAVFMLSAAFVSYSSAENFGEKYDHSLLWLEKVNGKRALKWVRKQNQQTLRELTADPLYTRFKKQAYAILTAPNRITYGTLRSGYVYNFWRDKDHVRGIWRRTTVARYKAGHYKWEVLLDIDALAKKQGKNWVYKGADCLAPDYNRCLISLSPGGTDATTYREFDITTKSFVKGGFQVPLSKTDLGWQDKNTLLIATNWGPDKHGVSAMNTSGYSRIVKRWHRGTKLRDATTVLTMRPTETFSFSQIFTRPEGRAVFIGRGHDFYHISYYLVAKTGDLKPLPLPEMSNLEGLFRGQILVNLKQD
ncbi:MAG: S9 family peptidase, partial [Alphaproteobacteria bacterium]|nr:S9 family peptidase [Alphaproteobacteria bacterium]